jgi:hypothetical protein
VQPDVVPVQRDQVEQQAEAGLRRHFGMGKTASRLRLAGY